MWLLCLLLIVIGIMFYSAAVAVGLFAVWLGVICLAYLVRGLCWLILFWAEDDEVPR